jgi:hypothetical protein
MDFTDYQRQVVDYHRAHPEQRNGQAHFNVLYQMNPHLADEIRGTVLDPFHRDDRVPAFLTVVYGETM